MWCDIIDMDTELIGCYPEQTVNTVKTKYIHTQPRALSGDLMEKVMLYFNVTSPMDMCSN